MTELIHLFRSSNKSLLQQFNILIMIDSQGTNEDEVRAILLARSRKCDLVKGVSNVVNILDLEIFMSSFHVFKK